MANTDTPQQSSIPKAPVPPTPRPPEDDSSSTAPRFVGGAFDGYWMAVEKGTSYPDTWSFPGSDEYAFTDNEYRLTTPPPDLPDPVVFQEDSEPPVDTSPTS